jgi:hypothetical protein
MTSDLASAAAAPVPRGDAEPVPFVVTKEHRRFAEFADAVRRDRYIGLCYGAPGVGKTLSAWQYTGWDVVGPYLKAFRLLDTLPVPQQAMASRSIVYTPKVHNSPRILDKEITFLHDRLSWASSGNSTPTGASRTWPKAAGHPLSC